MRFGLLSTLSFVSAALLWGLLGSTSAHAWEDDAHLQIAEAPISSSQLCKDKPRHQRDIADPDANPMEEADPSPHQEDTTPEDTETEEENNPEGDESESEPAPNANRNAFGRNHPIVLDVFNDVVKVASSSTVEILSGGKVIALGTVIASDGWVMTKASELEDSIQCQLGDGRSMPAEVIGVDDENDLALLRIEANNLVPIKWREGPIQLGSWLAVPSPTGDPVSIGVVSVIPREIAFEPGLLGIMIEEGDTGPSIGEIIPGSAAEESGLLPNDIVLKINDTTVNNREDLIATVRKFRPGAEISVTILRDDEEMVFESTLRSRSSGAFDRGDYQDHMGGQLSDRRAGFTQVLQHDCILRPNECGGPLVDLEGDVVGINIARAGRVNSYTLPVDLVLRIAQKLSGGILTFHQLEASPQVADLDQQIAQILERMEALEQDRADSQASLRRLESAIDDALEESQQAELHFNALKEALSLLRQQADQNETE